MKKYIDYKNKVEGFKDVSLTVKTVEKIAASHIHFLKERTKNLNTYSKTVELILARLQKFYLDEDNVFLKKGNSRQKLLVFLSADRGLVGGMYHKLANFLLRQKDEYHYIVTIGHKGRDYVQEEGLEVLKNFSFRDYLPTVEEIHNISDYIFKIFKQKPFKQVDVLYPAFVGLVNQEPRIIQFLPFNFSQSQNEASQIFGLPIFATKPRELFNKMLKKYIKIFFTHLILEAKLSEFSARTVAMEHAAVKTEEILNKVKLDYFKTRRRLMTQKQLESFAVHCLRKR